MKFLRARACRRNHERRIVTLYTRAGCHLCDDARNPVARAVAGTPGATLRIVDIAGDAVLESRFGQRIPVVTAVAGNDEHVIAEGKVSDIRLRRALSALPGGA